MLLADWQTIVKHLMGKVISRMLLLCNVVLLMGLLVHLQAQEQGKLDDPVKLRTELVMLDVHVFNKRTRRVVSDLRQYNFILFEDGTRQQITHFSQDRLPLSIVLLLDASGSVSTFFNQIQHGGVRALQRLKPEDEVALMAFETEAAIVQDFTQNRQLIADKIANGDGMRSTLNEARQQVGDGTHIADSIYTSAHHLLKAANPLGRRIIIVVTDNEPWETWVMYTKRAVINQLNESGSVVYGLIALSRYKRSKLHKLMKYHPAILLRDMRRNKGGNVNTYADITGGLVLDVSNDKTEAKLAELIELLRSRYTLGYVPTNSKRDGKLRKVKVEISPEVKKREGEVSIITRKGYYAPRGDSMSEAAKESPSRGKRVRGRD